MKVIKLLKAHGSRNDVLILDGGASGYFGTRAELAEGVRLLCDRGGMFGADGVYFVDRKVYPVQVEYFNCDGSFAEICGNGLRCVGRWLTERTGEDEVAIRMGKSSAKAYNAEDLAPGVRAMTVEGPKVAFSAVSGPPILATGMPHLDLPITGLHSGRRFSAVTVPNPHLVGFVDEYSEEELLRLGEEVAMRPDIFPIGANVSLAVEIAPSQWFVRTYERGAGLTPSCGSAVIAVRTVLSKLGIVDPNSVSRLYNLGGYGEAWLDVTDDGYRPLLRGNATFVYSATIDLASLQLLNRPSSSTELDEYVDEIAAFGRLHDKTQALLDQTGIRTTGPH